METLKMTAHIGDDGILSIDLPTGVTNIDCEVTITLQPKMTHEEWMRFIDATAGSLADDPIERLPQGVHEVRDNIK